MIRNNSKTGGRGAARLRELLKAEKRRLTSQRELLLKIIREQGHLDADELYRLAKRRNPRLSLSTVYRTLSLLKELDLVEELRLGKEHRHYEAKAEEHHHLICLGCGKVVECFLSERMQELGERYGFEVVRARVELLGYCPACRKRRSE